MRIEEESESELLSESDSEEMELAGDDVDDSSSEALSDSSSPELEREWELEAESLGRVSSTPRPRFCGWIVSFFSLFFGALEMAEMRDLPFRCTALHPLRCSRCLRLMDCPGCAGQASHFLL